MKQVKAFQTDDGLLFEEKEQAQKHQMFLDKKSMVQEFVKSDANPYRGKSQMAMVGQTIVNWETWKVKNAPE
jgi:hypothetical protein